MAIDRRRFLYAGLVASLGGVAGCSSPSDSDDGNDKTPTSAPTDTLTDTPTPTGSGSTTGPPGADELGGPGNLQSAPTVRAATLDADQGAGTFVFTPAVVWIESGTTVTWEIEGASHSVTAYHPDNDKPLRIPENAAAFDSGTLADGDTYEHTFETPGVYNYYCTPHESLGMTGIVIVDEASDGPGTNAITDLSGTPAQRLERQLTAVAGLTLSDGGSGATYGWEDATWDSYWYSLYNMSTNIAMSGNGVTFPSNDQQQAAFEQRLPAMLQAANQEKPPVKNPNLNMMPFTTGDPHFTQEPVLSGEDGRPDAATLQWDKSESSGIVSPSSVAWTHLKGVTWAKNFQNHFDILPDSLAAEFRSEVLSTLAQVGINATLIGGGPEGNGALTKGESMELISGLRPAGPEVVDGTARPHHHAAMLWFLGDMVSLANGGWFGYENPEPMVPAEKIQGLADGLGKTVMNTFDPDSFENTRDIGEMLGGIGWYGTHAGSDDLATSAADYANTLADWIESEVDDNGKLANGAANQAATQGIAGQGLVWASQVDGVDRVDLAGDVLGYLVDTLYDDNAGTFASAEGASTYTITARDAGDITGGLNAANAELDMDVQATFARFFNQTFNRGRLQRAERPQSREASAEHTLPLPPMAGGENGQAAVYNAEVEYDVESAEWSVTDPTFDTEGALYLANQDIWIGQWGGEFFQGRGLPGKNDTPK
ncbi:MAG: plastocyanin/azurin family copper-binding protein [Halobacteriales archaeon]